MLKRSLKKNEIYEKVVPLPSRFLGILLCFSRINFLKNRELEILEGKIPNFYLIRRSIF